MIEYMTLNVTLYLDDAALNRLGQEGWELAHIIPDPEGDVYMRYIFMRDREWADQHRQRQGASRLGVPVS